MHAHQALKRKLQYYRHQQLKLYVASFPSFYSLFLCGHYCHVCPPLFIVSIPSLHLTLIALRLLTCLALASSLFAVLVPELLSLPSCLFFPFSCELCVWATLSPTTGNKDTHMHVYDNVCKVLHHGSKGLCSTMHTRARGLCALWRFCSQAKQLTTSIWEQQQREAFGALLQA